MNKPESEHPPILYVKSFCSWCSFAEAELKRLGVRYKEVNVSKDRAAFEKMIELSGQSYAPTLVAGEHVLADFGPEELRPFLETIGLIGDKPRG